MGLYKEQLKQKNIRNVNKMKEQLHSVPVWL